MVFRSSARPRNELGVALALLAGASVHAEDLKSGVQVGRTMLSMPIEKRGGLADGVKVGDTICYT